MTLYRYEAVDRSGKIVRGVMDASSEQQVAQKLGAMGYSPNRVYGASGSPSGGHHRNAAAVPAQNASGSRDGIAAVTVSGVPVSIKSRVPASALAVLFRQMATLVRSGHPVYQASSVMRISNRRLRFALRVIQDRVGNGQRLSGAMAEFPGVFPVHAVASVWCGELAGILDRALDEVASDFEREAADTMHGRIGWGITKIGAVLTILLLPLVDLNRMVAAVAGQGYAGVVKYFAQATGSMLPFVAVVVLSWVVWGSLKRVPAVRLLLDRLVLGVPVWGTVHRCRSIAQFARTMDRLLNAGIHPATAWDAAALTPRNSALAARLKLTRPASPNEGIVELMERAGVFRQDDIGIAVAGRQSGSLPEMMANLAADYTARAESARTVGRTWSLSLMVAAQIAMGGIILILMAMGYRTFLVPVLDGLSI